MQLISVIIPAFNEGESVCRAYDVIKEMLVTKIPQYQHEIIFVDDGSSDDTFRYIETICSKDTSVKGIKFLNNSGVHTAIIAGIKKSIGDFVVFIACDLQDPPDIIPLLLEKLVYPYDIVLAIRKKRTDSLKVKFFSTFFFLITKYIISNKLPIEGSSMYLMNKRVTTALKNMNEKNITLESIFVLLNFQYIGVYYERQKREFGSGKWTYAKKIKFFIDFFVAYSYKPIRFVSLMGIIFSFIGFLWTGYIILRQFIVGDLTSGWPALMSVLLIGFGVTNISLGIIAEYLWRTLDESRNRPKYIIEKTINFDKSGTD